MPINMQDLKSKIIDYIRTHGPSLPVQLSKQIHSNILFAGAVLSELVANQKIKISHAKIGGSPIYYLSGQEARLIILYPHLHEKEKKAYDLLKENKILYDKILEPWQRVALRELKDFAYPLEFNNDLFWRWYLFSEPEAQQIIQESIKQNVLKENDAKVEVKIPEVVKEEIKQELIHEPNIQIKEEVQTKIEPLVEPFKQQDEIKIRKEIEKKKLETEIKKPKKIKKTKKNLEEFYLSLNDYLSNKPIEKLEENIIKKNKEFEIIANVKSDIGLVRFFITAKDKKKISDADLSLAHNKAQLKKLPLIFISNGDLTKQAKEYMQKNYLVFEKI